MDINHFFIEKGQGEPLILLHGNGENCECFHGQIDELSKQYHVYAIDTRGHGKTPGGNSSNCLNPNQYRRIVRSFIGMNQWVEYKLFI